MVLAIRKTITFILMAGLFLAGLVVLAACSPMLATPTGHVEALVATAFPTLTPTRTLTPTLTLTPGPTTEIVCPSGDCAYTCLSKLRSFLNSAGSLSLPASIHPSQDRSVEMTPLVTYQVQGDQITSPVLATKLAADLLPYQTASAAQQKIWGYFAKIIPPDQRKDLKTFIIATDGAGGVLASLGFSTADLTGWQLSLDIVDAVDPTNMTYSLIHEFGHLLTLNHSQVSPDLALLDHPNDQQVRATESAACPQYLTPDGCSRPDSIINLFFQKFWVGLYPSWTGVNAEKDPATYNKLLGEFYYAHQDQFVTPYSVTSPDEDVAESWAHFVLGGKPAGHSIADQKVLFFYDYPNLVQLRNQMVNAICLYAAGK